MLSPMPDSAQRVLAGLLGIAFLPLLLILAIAIRIDSPGPVIYRAIRVGKHGRFFTCYKLRTMTARDEAGPPLTVRGDSRVTRVGRRLRRAHLDELPQLWNVARGEMRLVGPRPEDPRFVDFDDPVHRVVFWSTPGMTGLSQLLFADEADSLDEHDLDRSYGDILRRKLAIDQRYLALRSTRLDLWILWRTTLGVLGRTETTIAEVESWT
jgi:lipopolysaccharide/colanic/teichoic acid biosynthesis glycosyltransferase